MCIRDSSTFRSRDIQPLYSMIIECLLSVSFRMPVRIFGGLGQIPLINRTWPTSSSQGTPLLCLSSTVVSLLLLARQHKTLAPDDHCYSSHMFVFFKSAAPKRLTRLCCGAGLTWGSISLARKCAKEDSASGWADSSCAYTGDE